MSPRDAGCKPASTYLLWMFVTKKPLLTDISCGYTTCMLLCQTAHPTEFQPNDLVLGFLQGHMNEDIPRVPAHNRELSDGLGLEQIEVCFSLPEQSFVTPSFNLLNWPKHMFKKRFSWPELPNSFQISFEAHAATSIGHRKICVGLPIRGDGPLRRLETFKTHRFVVLGALKGKILLFVVVFFLLKTVEFNEFPSKHIFKLQLLTSQTRCCLNKKSETKQPLQAKNMDHGTPKPSEVDLSKTSLIPQACTTKSVLFGWDHVEKNNFQKSTFLWVLVYFLVVLQKKWSFSAWKVEGVICHNVPMCTHVVFML